MANMTPNSFCLNMDKCTKNICPNSDKLSKYKQNKMVKVHVHTPQWKKAVSQWKNHTTKVYVQRDKTEIIKNRFHTIRPRTDVSTSSAAAGRPEPEILMKPQNQSR